MKRTFVLAHDEARRRAVECVQNAPDGYRVIVDEPKRSLDQNAAQWPILEAFARQLEWPVNGRMVKLDAEDWKDILTAAFRKEARIAEGLDGGFVFLGQRTSQMSRRRFSDWLEFLKATAAERGVQINEPPLPKADARQETREGASPGRSE